MKLEPTRGVCSSIARPPGLSGLLCMYSLVGFSSFPFDCTHETGSLLRRNLTQTPCVFRVNKEGDTE